MFAAYSQPDCFIHFLSGNRLSRPFEELLAATRRRTRGPLFSHGNPAWSIQSKLQLVTSPDSKFSPKLLGKGYLAL